MTIDLHAHVIVPEILREAAPEEDWRPIVRREGRAQIVEIGGRGLRSAVQDIVNMDAILDRQRAVGVDRVVVCPFVPLLFYDAEPEEGLRRCRIQNEALAGIVRERPEVSALGAVPLQDPELAATELRALMEGGELRGVEVGASVGGVYLGDDSFEPFWAAAESTGALVFIHPTTRGFDFPDYYLWNAVGNPFETTITAAHMVMAGVLERHPRLRVLLAHGGGALLALRGRLTHAHAYQRQARARLREPPGQSLKRLFYDTVVHDVTLLRALVEFAGPGQVVLGSDYPFDMGDPHPVETVRACGFEPEDEAAILGGTAARLLGIREEIVT
jgi:aminocarboxymuconate-semialdehyde decarboxylase